MGVRRALIALPAVLAVLFASQAQADTITETFENPGPVTELQVTVNGLTVTTSTATARYTNQYAGSYGTSGFSLFIGSGTGSVVLDFPTGSTGFSFTSGAKNGNEQATVTYLDGTTASFLILDDCSVGCTRTQTFTGDRDIDSVTIPLGWDLWLLDNLTFDDTAPATTTTSTVEETTTTVAETTTTTTSTTTTTTSPEQAAEAERKEEQRRDYEKATECEKVNHAFESCPLWPGRTSTSTSTVPETTTTSTTTTSTVPETTTSVTTTSSSTSVPETTVPATTVPETTVPETTVPETTVPDTTVPDTTVPAVEPAPPSQPAAEAAAQATVAALTILTEPDTLATLPVEQLEEVFAALEPELMTAAEGEAIAQALNKAPKKAKKAFQENVNVFAGIFDSFVMADQKIPVEDRRTLIAVANTMAALGTVLTRRRQ